MTFAGHVGPYQHEEQDVQRFVEWGYDFLKYDWCSYGEVIKYPDQAGFREALQADRRHSQTPAARHRPEPVPVRHGRRLGVGQIGRRPELRTAGDFGAAFEDIPAALFRDGFDLYAQRELHRFGGPGGWNDPDYLLLGYLSNWRGKPVPTPFTPDEQYTHVSLWCLLAAPLIFSGDVTRLDDFTLGLLCNDEVIDVDQDPLGRPGRRVAKDQKLEVWAKDMKDGSRAVGLFNRGESAATVTARWADLELSGPQVVRDLWRQKDLGQFDGRFEATVPRHGVVLVRISRLP